jgi:drug/metabolite transporter (DMT)-like permease
LLLPSEATEHGHRGFQVMTAAIVAALLAAALFAVATAFQHRSAGLVTVAEKRGGGFVTRTLRHPLWIVGSVANLAGLGLHAVALRDGPLTLVQPLLVIGVIFTLPLRQVLEHRRPGRAEIGWAIALTLGLALFLVLATPANGPVQGADPAPMWVCAAAIALAIASCLVAGRRTTTARAMLLGMAAGLLFAVAAALLKETTSVLGHGAAALFTTWPGYALVAVGGAGLLLSQLAYRAGPLSASLPAITAVNPIVSVIIGVAVFDEPFRTAPGYLIGEVLGLALMAVAAVGLTRSVPDDRTDRPSQGHRSSPSSRRLPPSANAVAPEVTPPRRPNSPAVQASSGAC